MLIRKFKKFLNKQSLLTKILVAYLIVFTLYLLFSFSLSSYSLRKSQELFIKQIANNFIDSISEDIELYLLTRLDIYLKNVTRKINDVKYILGLYVYDQDGKIIYVYRKQKYSNVHFNIKDQDFLTYKDKNVGNIMVFSRKIDIVDQEAGLPILHKTGYIRVDFWQNYFDLIRKDLVKVNFLAYILFAILAFILAFYFSKSLTQPLHKLTIAAKRVRQGSFVIEDLPPSTRFKEFNELIEAFRSMIQAIKLREESLRQAEEHFRIVADFTSDWEYWIGPEGTFLYISPSCLKITGYPPEAFYKDPSLYERIIHPEDLPRWHRHRRQAHVENRQVKDLEIEFRIIRADGKICWISHVCNLVYTKEGRFMGYRGSNRDITYRKELEEKIFQTEKLESIARLAGGVAHDLNNLMAAVVGHAELLNMKLPPEAKEREHARKILDAAQRASMLAEQLLTYARGGKPKSTHVDLNKAIKDVLSIQESSLPEAVRLELNLSPELWPIYADPGQISQIIMNLTLNAVEAMKGNGILEITTANLVLNTPMGDLPSGKYVLLKVSDTGCGMDKETMSKIFDPFFSTKDFGRGLGLAAVYGIVRNHGGHIIVQSTVGKGTTFEIYFPVIEEIEEETD